MLCTAVFDETFGNEFDGRASKRIHELFPGRFDERAADVFDKTLSEKDT